jgi:hypothetical protein
VAGSDAVLWALKPAEEGIDEGMVARVWNLAEAPRTISLELTGLDPVNATRTTHIETDLEPIDLVGATLTDVLARQEMRTYRIRTSGILDAEEPVAPSPAAHQVAVTPLPASALDVVRIRFTTTAATEHLRVRVYDAQGREVARLADGVFDRGRHELAWATVPGHDPGPGLYYVRVEGATTRLSGRVLRVP